MSSLRRLALVVTALTVLGARVSAAGQAPAVEPTGETLATQQQAAPSPPRVGTDKFAYAAGETARIAGAGFLPGETVVLRVGHVVGPDEGEAHLPFVAVSDSEGRIAETWAVPATDSGGRLLQLTAEGQSSGALAVATLSATEIMIVDDAGPDDYPGQKDLNFFTFD